MDTDPVTVPRPRKVPESLNKTINCQNIRTTTAAAATTNNKENMKITQSLPHTQTGYHFIATWLN